MLGRLPSIAEPGAVMVADDSTLVPFGRLPATIFGRTIGKMPG